MGNHFFQFDNKRGIYTIPLVYVGNTGTFEVYYGAAHEVRSAEELFGGFFSEFPFAALITSPVFYSHDAGSLRPGYEPVADDILLLDISSDPQAAWDPIWEIIPGNPGEAWTLDKAGADEEKIFATEGLMALLASYDILPNSRTSTVRRKISMQARLQRNVSSRIDVASGAWRMESDRTDDTAD